MKGGAGMTSDTVKQRWSSNFKDRADYYLTQESVFVDCASKFDEPIFPRRGTEDYQRSRLSLLQIHPDQVLEVHLLGFEDRKKGQTAICLEATELLDLYLGLGRGTKPFKILPGAKLQSYVRRNLRNSGIKPGAFVQSGAELCTVHGTIVVGKCLQLIIPVIDSLRPWFEFDDDVIEGFRLWTPRHTHPMI